MFGYVFAETDLCHFRFLLVLVPYICMPKGRAAVFCWWAGLSSSALGPVGPGSYREKGNCTGKPELLASRQVCNVYKILIAWWSTRLPRTLSISSMTLFQAKLPYACQSRFNCCFFSLNSTQKHYMTLARPAVPEKCSRNSCFLSQPSRLRMSPAANHPTVLCRGSADWGSRYFTKSGQHYKGATGNCKAEQQLAARSTALIFSVPFLWLSAQTIVPFERTQTCVILSYRQICGCH